MADMTLEEALAAATVDEELVTPVNEVLMINPETRTINVPDSEKLFGVRQDMSVERKYFKCPRIVGDNIDLFEHYVFVNYIPSDQNGKYESEKDVQGYWCKDLAVEGDFITFSWELTENVLRKAGYIAFAVYAKVSDENGNLKTKWHTTIAIGNVLDTLPDGEEWITVYPDIVMQLLERMDEVEKIATEEAMQGYVDDYFNRNPMMIDRELKDETKAAPADIVGKLSEDIADLKENGTGGGLTSDLKTALTKYFTDMQTVFTQIAYGTDNNMSLSMIANAQAVVTALESNGEVEPDNPDIPDTPDEPDVPTKTLSSISATYTGDNVPVGTAVTDLTGIVVIATYSDGSTSVVNDYKLSGEIVEGNNTITVSYGGITTTFTVVGYVESADEEWVVTCEIGDNYTLGTIDITGGTGGDVENEEWYRSDYIEVPEGTTSFTYITSYTGKYVAWYDADKKYIGNGWAGSYSGNTTYGGGYTDENGDIWNVVPSEARYCRVSWKSKYTSTSVKFKHNTLLNENVKPVCDKVYYYNVDSTISDVSIYNVDYLNCEGMIYAQLRPVHRRKIEFYDADHSVVSTINPTNNLGNNVIIPEGAKYMRFSTVPKVTLTGGNTTYTGYGLIKFTETELTEW